MTDYYCDISESIFVDRSGTDGSANVLTGPAGLQAVIRGTGLATALGPGDRLLVKAGSGDLSRLVLIDCNAASVTGWGLGDVVRNKDGAPAWRGVVVETNSGGYLGADDMALLWLDSGYDVSDIAVADGVTNDDAGGGANDPTDVASLADRSAPGIHLESDGASSDPMKIVGVNASWVEDGSPAILDCGGLAYTGFRNSVLRQYTEFRNIHTSGAVGSAWAAGAYLRYCALVNCTASGSGGGGFGAYIQYGSMLHCKAYDNAGGNGFNVYGSTMVNCVAYNNGSSGFSVWMGTAVNCVSYENLHGFHLGQGGGLANCVADKNSSYGVYAPSYPMASIVGCRITNNASYGIRGAKPLHDPYCFYSGNGANFDNDIHDDTVRGSGSRVTTGVVGYIDNDDSTPNHQRNYGLTNQAASRRQAVSL